VTLCIFEQDADFIVLLFYYRNDFLTVFLKAMFLKIDAYNVARHKCNRELLAYNNALHNRYFGVSNIYQIPPRI